MSSQMSLVTDRVQLFKGVFMVQIPDGYLATVQNLLEKKNGYVHLMLGTPQKAKSTGFRSEINLIHGSCESIAEQLGYYENMPKAQAVEYVKRAMKRMAVGTRGYPTIMNDIDGHEEPMSLSQASSEQAQMVINTILDYCAMNGLWLIRYTEDAKPEKYDVATEEVIE